MFRRNLRIATAKDEIVNTITLQIGKSRFSLSGGIGISSVDNVKITRQTCSVNTNNVGSCFGYETNSCFQTIAILMLNGHLIRRVGFTIALSTGIVINGNNTEIEYVFGPSFGFLHNNLFLTIGAHIGQVEELAGGFQIGDEVPSNLSDPIPIKRDQEIGLIFAITYKLK